MTDSSPDIISSLGPAGTIGSGAVSVSLHPTYARSAAGACWLLGSSGLAQMPANCRLAVDSMGMVDDSPGVAACMSGGFRGLLLTDRSTWGFPLCLLVLALNSRAFNKLPLSLSYPLVLDCCC